MTAEDRNKRARYGRDALPGSWIPEFNMTHRPRWDAEAASSPSPLALGHDTRRRLENAVSLPCPPESAARSRDAAFSGSSQRQAVPVIESGILRPRDFLQFGGRRQQAPAVQSPVRGCFSRQLAFSLALVGGISLGAVIGLGLGALTFSFSAIPAAPSRTASPY